MLSRAAEKRLAHELERLTKPSDAAKVLEMAMNESQHGAKFIAWRDDLTREVPELAPYFDDIYHIPNGGKRDALTATKLKREGVKAGVPDYFWPLPYRAMYCHPTHGLYIELKAPGGSVRPEQKDFMQRATERGYKCAVSIGWRSAGIACLSYFGEYLAALKAEAEAAARFTEAENEVRQD